MDKHHTDVGPNEYAFYFLLGEGGGERKRDRDHTLKIEWKTDSSAFVMGI